MWFQFIINILFVIQVLAQYEGEPCSINGKGGICTRYSACNAAQRDFLIFQIKPKICSYQKEESIVCCEKLDPIPVATTTLRPAKTTTEYIPPVYDYSINPEIGSRFQDICEPIHSSLTSNKTGNKAWDKCLEYQEKCVYPCEKSVALSGTFSRVNKCHHNADDLIVGGEDAGQNEFPHMVLLGYNEPPEPIEWECGGSIISERFILTAAHCTFHNRYGKVTYAAVGVYSRRDVRDPNKRYGIEKIIRHHEYEPTSVYDDIALLRTDRPIELNEFVVPACLDVLHEDQSREYASATGWGFLQNHNATLANILQKVTLTSFERNECAAQFTDVTKMSEGLKNSQLCYGDKLQAKDTCRGDSGGPLQIKSKKINCMYVIVGVTSTGRGCGTVGLAGLFTRVSDYVPWIENIVWHQKN